MGSYYYLVRVTAFLGGAIKAGYDAWKHHRLPFKKDKEQYEAIVTKDSAQIVKFFKENNNPFIEFSVTDALETCQEILGDPYWPEHQNRKLKSKKADLVKAVGEMDEFLGTSTQPASNGGGFILPSDEDIKKRYFNLRASLIKTLFESYRDYGAKIFSVKISKEPRNG